MTFHTPAFALAGVRPFFRSRTLRVVRPGLMNLNGSPALSSALDGPARGGGSLSRTRVATFARRTPL